jgi:hypothetical protein
VHRAPLAVVCTAALVLVPPVVASAAAADESASAPITVNLQAGSGTRSVAAALEPSPQGHVLRVDVDEVARADDLHWFVTATVGATTYPVVDGWGRAGVLSTRHRTAARDVSAPSGTVVITLFQ